jgi:serine/threonine protein kinase
MRPADLTPGSVLDGRYRIERLAGTGGHGLVYRAHHLTLGVPVAVKVLRVPEFRDASEQSALLASFRREGKLLSRLSSTHPAFVQAKEAGSFLSSEGRLVPYLVLEWLEGQSLSQALKRRRAAGLPTFDVRQVIAVLDGPAAGLAVAHRHGIAHCDLKPGNLFVTVRDAAVSMTVLDFGLAKVIEDQLATQSNTEPRPGSQAFTPAYGAPEQWLRRLGSTGTWTDVHAWALIGIELMLGRPALAGADSAQLMGACLDATRPTPQRCGLLVSDGIEAVYERALAIQPRDRFQTVGDFWQALRDAAEVAEGRMGVDDLRSLIDDWSAENDGAEHPETVRQTAPPTQSRAVPRRPRAGTRARLAVAAAAAGILAAFTLTRAAPSQPALRSHASPKNAPVTGVTPAPPDPPARVSATPASFAPVAATSSTSAPTPRFERARVKHRPVNEPVPEESTPSELAEPATVSRRKEMDPVPTSDTRAPALEQILEHDELSRRH